MSKHKENVDLGCQDWPNLGISLACSPIEIPEYESQPNVEAHTAPNAVRRVGLREAHPHPSRARVAHTPACRRSRVTRAACSCSSGQCKHSMIYILVEVTAVIHRSPVNSYSPRHHLISLARRPTTEQGGGAKCLFSTCKCRTVSVLAGHRVRQVQGAGPCQVD